MKILVIMLDGLDIHDLKYLQQMVRERITELTADSRQMGENNDTNK